MPRARKRRKEGPKYRERMRTFVARVWEVDGSCSGWVDLGTDNRQLAEEALARWVETGEKPETDKAKEPFEKAAERIVDKHEATGAIEPDLAKDRRTRLRAYAYPVMGQVEVGRVKTSHVVSVMEAMVSAKKGAGYILKMRSDISQILAQLRREDAIESNCARELPLPKSARMDTRIRSCLTTEQVAEFQRKRGFATPLDMMVLFSRCVAGSRTSDEHAGVWSDICLETFATMKVRRPKTDEQVGDGTRVGRTRVRAYEMVDHGIDEQFREPIRQYWIRQGRPTKGPIFPLLRGGVAAPMTMKDGRVVMRKASVAGGHKGRGSSYAEPLRQAVWDAGIYDPDPEQDWDPEHPEKSKCRFQTDTKTTKRLDFKSFRLALSTALADAGVDMATSLAITGHTQVQTKLRHYQGKRRVQVPKGALPGGEPAEKTGPAAAPIFPPEVLAAMEVLRAALATQNGAGLGSHPRFGTAEPIPTVESARKSLKHLASPRGVEPLTNALGTPRRPDLGSEVRVTTEAVPAVTTPSNPVPTHVLGANERGPDDPLLALQHAAAQAVARGDWALADRIRHLLSPAPIAPILKLTQTRKRLR
jgi:hypothetical protein